MEETKPWYQSKAIWASLLIVVVAILGIVGQPEQAAVVEGESGAIADWIVETITLVLGVIAFYGRITAKKKLTQ